VTGDARILCTCGEPVAVIPWTDEGCVRRYRCCACEQESEFYSIRMPDGLKAIRLRRVGVQGWYDVGYVERSEAS